MDYKQIELTYTLSNLLETLTRQSTETPKPSHSFRSYARKLKVNERSIYKLISRAYRSGFSLGISLNYTRLGAARFLIKFDQKPDVEPNYYAKYLTLEGAVIYDLYLPLRCEKLLEATYQDAEIYTVKLEWGARHALASAGLLSLSLEKPLPDKTREKLRQIYLETLARGIPSYFYGRHYPYDSELLALLIYTKGKIGITAVSRLARELGFSIAKMQRKFYSMWDRRVIMGYTIEDAPYFTNTNIVLSVRGENLANTIYASPTLIGVYSGMLTSHKGKDIGLIWLKTNGIIAAEIVSIIKEYNPEIKVEGYFYLKEKRTDYLSNLKDISKKCYSDLLKVLKTHH